MFKVEELVWHRQYKRGMVAYAMPGDVRVMWDDYNYNPLISTEPPPFLYSKKDLELMSSEERVEALKQMEKAKEKGAPLGGHVIGFPGGEKPSKRSLTQYNYLLQDGFFKVLSVGQTFTGMKWEEYGPQHLRTAPEGGTTPAGERKFFPAEGIVDIKMEDVKTGKKYTIQLDRGTYPSVHVAKQVPEESLAVLFEEGDVFWPEQE